MTMTLKCGGCGNDMVVEGVLQNGAHILCPSCGETTVYQKPCRIEIPVGQERLAPGDKSQEVPSARPRLKVIRKPDASSVGARIPQPPPVPPRNVPPVRRSPKKTSGGGNGLLLALVAMLCLGGGLWWYRKSVADAESIQSKAMQDQRAKDELLRKKQAEEDEIRRKKREEEDTRLRLERQREREQKEKERAAQREAQKRKAEADRLRRETYGMAQEAFRGKTSYFAVSASKDEVIDPRSVTSEMKLWGVDGSYCSKGNVYEIQTGSNGITSVRELTLADEAVEIDVEEFKKRMESSVWAIANENEVWIFGTGKQARFVSIPKDRSDVCPMAEEMGSVDASLEALRLKLPEVKYRLTLKPKSGGEDLPLGIIEGATRLPFEKMKEAIRNLLAERNLQKAGAKIKRPRMKKFKQTVMFYDGDKMVKKLEGITLVPKVFKYFGTSRYHDDKRHVQDIIDRARRVWEDAKAEAERQEKRLEEVEAENYAAVQEYKRKVDELSRNVAVSEQEIAEELQKYRLYVERSRTRVVK